MNQEKKKLVLVFYECQLQLVDYDALLGMMDFTFTTVSTTGCLKLT